MPLFRNYNARKQATSFPVQEHERKDFSRRFMMSNNFFERIEQEITLLQQRKAALKAENEDLYRQLASLRSGQNILIDIQGQRFSFSYSADTSTYTPIPVTLSEQLPAPTAPQKANKQATILSSETIPSAHNPTLAVKITPTYNTTPSAKFTPAFPTTPLVETASDYSVTPSVEALSAYGTIPSVGKGAEVREAELEKPAKKNAAPQPTFLEEIMLDEFAAAAANPTAIWTGPIKKLETINEDQKAALRRELMGSFLLE
jgi:hypothetical protein